MMMFFDGNTLRKLGLLPTDPHVASAFPKLEQAIDILPKAKWKPRDSIHLVRRIFDQGPIGSCTSEATVQAVETCRSLIGLKNTRLSPANLYGRVNGGVDNGSSIGSNLREIIDRGVCTEELVPHQAWREWNTKGWKSQGKKYRVTESYRIPSNNFSQCVSAVLHGYTVIYGVLTGLKFSPDTEGWLGDYSEGGSGAHALLGIGLGIRNGTWGIQTVNSWGPGWGLAGFCYVPSSYFSAYNVDAFAVRSVVYPRNDGDCKYLT